MSEQAGSFTANDRAATSITAPKPARRTPIRTCVACRTSGGKRGLLRVVRLPEAEREAAGVTVVLDPTRKRSGRGAYVCATAECVALVLKKKGFERSLKTPLPPSVADELKNLVTPPAMVPLGNENDGAASTIAAVPVA